MAAEEKEEGRKGNESSPRLREARERYRMEEVELRSLKDLVVGSSTLAVEVEVSPGSARACISAYPAARLRARGGEEGVCARAFARNRSREVRRNTA